MAPRYQIVFEDAVKFRREFEQNISNGGAFVHGAEECELRTFVEVEIVLAFCGETVALEAEVVHCGGGGVAVQFHAPASELRERFASIVDAAAEPAPESASAPEPASAPAAEPKREPEPAVDPAASLISHDPMSELDEPNGGHIDPQLDDHQAIDLSPDPEPAAPPSAREEGVFGTPVADLDFAGADLGEVSADDLEAALGTTGDPDAVDDGGELWDDSGADLGEGMAEELAPGAADDTLALVEPEEPEGEPGTPGDRDAPDEDLDPLVAVTDRRRAHRARARVPARLNTTDFSLAGHTRDLSETGALVSADATDVPVGKTVTLELVHPESGDRMGVRGRVRRHVATEGTVAAVGIEFEGPENPGDDVGAFVRDVKQTEAERMAGGITGSIEELGMVNLLQMLGTSSKLGTLTVECGPEEGVIAFENNMLRYVRLGSLRSVKALARMLSWNEGMFAFSAQVTALDDEDTPLPLDAAILEGLRQLDEATRADPSQFSPGTILAVDPKRLAKASDLDKTAAAVVDLAGAGCSVRRIMDVIPESDAEILKAICTLSDLRIVRVRD